jgi:hypothetical protein
VTLAATGMVRAVMKPATPASAVRRAYREELSPGQRSALFSWLAFTVTFAGERREGFAGPSIPQQAGVHRDRTHSR